MADVLHSAARRDDAVEGADAEEGRRTMSVLRFFLPGVYYSERWGIWRCWSMGNFSGIQHRNVFLRAGCQSVKSD